MYPFGFGMSYTEFEYSDLQIDGDVVRFKIKNTGSVSGAEIAQLYVAPHTGGMFRPARELKGFVRVQLEPGEERLAEIKLNDRSFAVWNTSMNSWTVEPGEYEILIGASSVDIRLSASIEKNGDTVSNPYTDREFEPYVSCDVFRIHGHNFSALLGRKLPRRSWNRYARLCVNDNVSQGEYLEKGMGSKLCFALKTARNILRDLGMWQLAGDVSFLINMPYRAIGRISGCFDDAQMAALMKLINGDDDGKEAFAEATRQRIKRKES